MIRSAQYADLERDRFDEVIAMLAEGVGSRHGRVTAHLLRDGVHGVVRARRGARLAAITCGGAIPDNATYSVVQMPEETSVGTLDEDFAIESSSGDIFQLGNTSWRIVRVEASRVLVEDAAELRPAHPHVVRLVARPPNVEGAGQVSLQDLVRQALRMRPDRLVVGETRGAEVADLLAAMNTGHEGGAGTVHANSAAEVPARIEALGSLAGLRAQAVCSQLLAAVDAVVHLRRDRAGVRRVVEIAVLERVDGLAGAAVAVPAWRRDGGPCEGAGRLLSLLAARGGLA